MWTDRGSQQSFVVSMGRLWGRRLKLCFLDKLSPIVFVLFLDNFFINKVNNLIFGVEFIFIFQTLVLGDLAVQHGN